MSHPNESRGESYSAGRLLPGAIAGAAVAILAATGVLPSPTGNKEKDHPSAADYRRALQKELTGAYMGPVVLKEARNTHRTTTRIDGFDRAIVKIKVDGMARNSKIADDKTLPPYMYTDAYIGALPVQAYKPGESPAQGGGKPGKGGWFDFHRGKGFIYPLLGNFSGRRPTTVHYHLGTAVHGILPPEGTETVDSLNEAFIGDGGPYMAAIYTAGSVDVTGSNGRITNVDVTPVAESETTPRIAELPAAQGSSLASIRPETLSGYLR